MERAEIEKMDNERLVDYFERVLRIGADTGHYLIVWARSEILQRLERAGKTETIHHTIERCPTCGGELVDGVGHDHRDDNPEPLEGRPRHDY